jgi:hypothetical protein
VCQKGFRKSLARPDNPGRILSKYPAPLFLAKCFRNFGSGRGPDIWPDNVPVLYQGRIIRAGYFGNIRPPRFSLRTGRKSTLEGGRTFGRTLSLFCPEDRIIRGGRIIRPLLRPDYPAPRKLQRLHFEWGYKYPPSSSLPLCSIIAQEFCQATSIRANSKKVKICKISFLPQPNLLIFGDSKEKTPIYILTEAFFISPSLV